MTSRSLGRCLGAVWAAANLRLYLPFQAPCFPFLFWEGRAVLSSVLRCNPGHHACGLRDLLCHPLGQVMLIPSESWGNRHA